MDNGASSYRRFLDGDESAFNEIIAEYRQPLTLFINRYVHDLWTAEDIAIDVFSRLVVDRRHYNFKVSLKTYLFMLGRSRALDHLRRKRLITFAPLEEAITMEGGEGPEYEFIKKEQRKAVNDSIKQLSRDMQDAIHLVYFEELSYEDAAKIMKKTKKQIDNLLYRAKNKLREILGEEASVL